MIQHPRCPFCLCSDLERTARECDDGETREHYKCSHCGVRLDPRDAICYTDYQPTWASRHFGSHANPRQYKGHTT